MVARSHSWEYFPISSSSQLTTGLLTFCFINSFADIIISEVTRDMNTAESSKVRKLPTRRLSRSSSAKGGSFRGGSLKNVMEDVEEKDEEYSQDVDDFTDGTILPTRGGLLRSSSGRVIRKKKNRDKKNTTKRLLPARRLSRSSSAKGGSFRGGSLKNVMEDEEADMYPPKEEQKRFEGDRVEGPAERRQSHPPGRSMLQSIAGSEASFRSSLVESIRLYNSNSSLSSASHCTNNNYNPRGSIDLSDASPNQSVQHNGSSINIMDFGVSFNRFASQSSMLSAESASQRSLSSTMSSNNNESLLDSDGFLGWGGSSSRNIRVELNPQIKGREGKSGVPMKKINTANVHPVSGGDKGSGEGLGSSNNSSLVDSQGFLNWEGNSSGHGDTSRALSTGNDGGAASSTADDQNEGKDANDDVVINLKQSTSSSRLSKRMMRLSSSLTASIKRSSWNNDEPNNGSSAPLRNSTSNASLKGSIIKTIFDKRRSSSETESYDQDEQYFERSIINHRSEDHVDISELRRELCVAAEGGANKKKLLKNVIF